MKWGNCTHTHPGTQKRAGTEEWERVGTEPGPAGVLRLSPSLPDPLELPVSKSNIYWEINTPWGVLSNLPEHTVGEGQLWPGPQHKDPRPVTDTRSDSMEKKLGTLVPSDFKGKQENGSSKSISPRVSFLWTRGSRPCV